MLLCNKLNQVVSMLESKLMNDGTTRTRTTQVIPRSLTTDKKNAICLMIETKQTKIIVSLQHKTMDQIPNNSQKLFADQIICSCLSERNIIIGNSLNLF